jgi:transcription-repair coupling factor (superfamily II helicase)
VLQQLLREDIEINDVIVHKDYGLGKFVGLDTVDKKDFLKIMYKNNSYLYIPIEDIDVITRYGVYEDGVTILDKLGNNKWAIRKQKAREKVKRIAKDLIEIAAKRQLSKAPLLIPDENEYKDFCSLFEYKETDDQLRAIEDVENDFKKGIPTDRLICGDVGFGKTEVALRASFIATNCGFQVAIVCPTTLLARQHYNLFVKRFKNTATTIEMISRLTTGSHGQIKRYAEEGKIDIIIGTHSLLSFKFKKLGLLIIDEEQRFGVKQKEKLKTVGDGIHLITLSATPIPRTLQMAMSGVRDLSLITTPPVDRLNVDTKICDMNKKIFKDAIEKEISRSGKVLIVVPRITDTVRIEEMIKKG